MKPAKAKVEVQAADVIEVVGIDHVQLSMPVGGEEAARQFYGGVLGLREIPKATRAVRPRRLLVRGLGAAIHLGVEGDFRPLAKAHPALLIRDLDAGRDALAAAGVPIEEDDAVLPVRRCYVHDPFGNRIELVDSRDAGFSGSPPENDGPSVRI